MSTLEQQVRASLAPAMETASDTEDFHFAEYLTHCINLWESVGREEDPPPAPRATEEKT